MKFNLKETLILGSMALIFISSCSNNSDKQISKENDSLKAYVAERLPIYAKVRLTTDIEKLSENERKVLPLLIRAAEIMDELFWMQSYPQRDSLMLAVKDEKTREFIKINYGPWDRLNDNKPFVNGIGDKPLGSGFYPVDMTREELEKSDVSDKKGLYSMIRRNESGKLISIPYSVYFKDELKKAADLLLQAAQITEEIQLKKYLTLRAEAFLTDNYMPSDFAWMDMTNSGLDIIIGPIENYEDGLFNARAAFESYVLVKDKEWSKRLEKYVAMLPELQRGLPVDAAYKKESPGTSSQLAAFDVVYYAGDGNSGGKTIAVNLPNDEMIQQKKGTRRSQLKNAMRAKFDKIMLPIAAELIDESQQSHLSFDAFFANVMFHEVAHGLGIKSTINGKGFVREALQEQYSWLEEGKADILGLYMVNSLLKKGELEGDIKEYYTTFMAGILRSVRFGAGEAHGKANMLCFNFFNKKGAFERTAKGRYKVNYEKFELAMNDLSREILTLQGNGDKAAVEKVQKEMALVQNDLQSDLDRLSKKGIPVDVIFEQGLSVLGLK
ncbi:Zn-dependent hydrolase [Daejeonella sp.]|uniref:dipeptidyl-peptidase 3 family protein n=1 Tax=Daejeonella sp. TaxID=2805397 RepID=UPI00271D27E6|nr:Zn-dependent hydrolase [Daejeonella sp.]MDO8994618.1 Zn-dependent hydrolase [Daejeonella sp.]MDP2413915.1 Zn-dependent hydrolase [Daejeonella sp.]